MMTRILSSNPTKTSEDKEYESIDGKDTKDEESNPDDKILVLGWATRDKLLLNLNRYLTILLNTKLNSDKKEKDSLIEENHALAACLMDLKSKSEVLKKINSNESEKDLDSGYKSPSFEVHWSFRSKLFKNLIENHHIIMKEDEADKRAVKNLINENKELIETLHNLPALLVVDGALICCNGKTPQSTIVKSIDKKKYTKIEVDANLTTLKEELIRKMMDEVFRLNESIKKTNKDVNLMGDELKLLKEEVNDLMEGSSNSTEINYLFKISNMKNFARKDECRKSDHFYLHNARWYLSIYYKIDDNNSKYVGLFLNCDYEPILKWSMKARIKFRLLSHISEANTKEMKFNYEFTGKEARGYREFVTDRDLMDPNLGFVKNDSFYIQLILSGDKPVGV